MYRPLEQGSITNLCCAPSFETAVPVGTGGADSVHLRGLWRVREGEFVTAQGQRLPLGAGGMEIADGECEIKKHVPWRDGLDEIGAPELREVCYVPRDMASSSSSSSFAAAAASLVSFAVRMPVEMRIGRRLFIEISWVLQGEHQVEKGGARGRPLVRHAVRRVYDVRGDYLGSAFATFEKLE